MTVKIKLRNVKWREKVYETRITRICDTATLVLVKELKICKPEALNLAQSSIPSGDLPG
jgi:hypothetical protein